MAIIAKFTRTLPAPTATISGGFVFLLSAGWFTQSDLGAAGSPIGGGANSIANGGGDMQIFSDTATTTRLPIEVVSFVTGGSPVAQVWVRTPSYTAGDTITIGKDSVQTVQPAVGAAFGRNAVWFDYEAVLHMAETGTDGVFVDSTGNGHDTTLTSGASLPVTSTGHPFGGTWPDFTGDEVIALANSYQTVNNTAFTLSCWMSTDVTSGSLGLFGSRYNSPDTNWAQIQSNGRMFTKASSAENFLAGSLFVNTTYSVKLKQDSATMDFILNGTLNSQNTSITDGEGINNTTSANGFRVGTYYNGQSSRRYNGRVAELRIKRSKDSVDFDSTEYSNLNDPDNFGTSSEWVLVGGGGGVTIDVDGGVIALTGSPLDLQYTPIVNTEINLDAGTLSLIGQSIALVKSSVIDIDTGNLSLSGEPLSLSKDALLTVDSGTLSFTGQEVLLTYTPIGNIGIDLDAGQLSLTGESLTLNKSSAINLDTGLLNLTGSDLGFLKGKGVDLSPGILSLTGESLSLTRSSQLNIDTGELSLSGSPLTLIYSGLIVIEVDNFTLSYTNDTIQPSYTNNQITLTYK